MGMSNAPWSDLLHSVSEDRLRHTIETLSSWNTRNTNTPEAREVAQWIATEFESVPGIEVEIWEYEIQGGRRVPQTKKVPQVIATLPGRSERRVMVGGHFDTLNADFAGDLFSLRAPGANDDGSGTAVALEMAKVLGGQKWENTLVFCAFSGEEQGLLGSRALAKRAADEGWKIDALLSNDMVGNSSTRRGAHDDETLRVFSEEAPQRHQSRELARWIEWITRGQIPGSKVRPVFRKDRFARGGDHTPFNEAGFTAVRFVEQMEEYSRQHTVDDLPNAIDYAYLAKNAKVNLIVLAALASAAAPPTEVKVDLGQSYDTTLHWNGLENVDYLVYWRETTSATWQGCIPVGPQDSAKLDLSKDDHVFAVGVHGGIPVIAE